MTNKAIALNYLWQGLQGTWQLRRVLQSVNTAEPSGICTGTAVFTTRQPAVFVDDDGKFQNASKEMLYAESGEFEMTSNGNDVKAPKFSFSRKYIWRLQHEKSESPEISIWFVKPGTETIDYLFHKFHIQNLTSDIEAEKSSALVECSGGHLCVEDFYHSNYTFKLVGKDTGSSNMLESWEMLHEVRGPKKDQTIETTFTR